MMMTTKNQFYKFLAYKGISPSAAERLLGWSVGSITKAKCVSADRAQEFLAFYPELSAEWLMRDEGPMIKGEVVPKEVDRIERLMDTIDTLQGVINEKKAELAAAKEKIRQLEALIK